MGVVKLFFFKLNFDQFLLFWFPAQVTPFKIDVKFDRDEIVGTGVAIDSEQKQVTGGIVGFNINYVQRPC